MARIPSKEVLNFIENIGKLAQEVSLDRKNSGKNWSLPSVCIAQAAMETGWGKSSIMTKANAYFGIKVGKNWKGAVYSTKTKEWYDNINATNITDLFKAYNSLKDSVIDYFNLICEYSRYEKATNTLDPLKCIQGIKDGGYSTYPSYVPEIMSIINSYNLTRFDNILKIDSNNNIEENIKPNKSLDEIAEDVINNKYGNGNERKVRLESEGYDYKAVQSTVNNIIKNKEKNNIEYYPKFEGNTNSIIQALNAVGCNDTSIEHRKEIAFKNNIVKAKFLYKGTAQQNTEMLKLLKIGKLIKE